MEQSFKAAINGRRRFLVLGGFSLLLILGIFLYFTCFKEYFQPKRWGVVEEGAIYRSGQISRRIIKKTLQQYQIKAIVDLCGDRPHDADQAAERQAAAELRIEYQSFPLGGKGTGDIKNYAGAITAMVKAKQEHKPVLVHCAAGAQRTGGVIAAYRLLVRGDEPAGVLEEMRKYGWKPDDNPYLMIFLVQRMPELAGQLQANGMKLAGNLPEIQIKKEGWGETLLVVFGLAAQGVFFGRFFLQWIASERKRQSVIPVGFWWMSLLGSVMLLIYSIYRKDPVFIIGQSTGFIIYVRNLYFIYRPDNPAPAKAEASAGV